MKQIQKKIISELQDDERPALRFSPYAWAKLLYFRDKGDTEIGGFGVTEPDDLLYVSDFVTVKQSVTSISVSFDDNAVADFFDQQVDTGRKPEQFARIWLHSHPGDSPEPSLMDEQTFKKAFGSCDWAVMFIIGQDNRAYARLSFNIGPRPQILIPVEVDYSRDFDASSRKLWEAEYKANINEVIPASTRYGDGIGVFRDPLVDDDSKDGFDRLFEIIDDFEELGPVERQLFFDEVASRPELWSENQEVMSYE